MKKIYKAPQLEVIEIKLNSMLCDVSAHVDTSSMSNESTNGGEDLVKSNSFTTNPIEWEGWQ